LVVVVAVVVVAAVVIQKANASQNGPYHRRWSSESSM